MGLSCEQILSINDPERIWQVRRFCQVRSGRTRHDDHGSASNQSISSCDAALTALLRCLLYEIDADMAAISLLDEQNQYFLSVVHAATIENPTVRRSDWFGCEKIFFRGGICERTITRGYESPASPIYEIPDLQVLEETKSLPVVDGRSANFKYYAGTPITTTQGLNVGALFIFKKNYLSQPLSSTKRKFIIETALSATEHLAQTIGAIENTRSLAFNASISSLPDYDKPGSASHVADVMNSIGNVESLKSELYGTAAHLLLQTLDLEHVVIQKVLRKGELLGTSAKTSTESILAEYHDPSAGPSQPVPQQLVEQLLRSWPSGVILQLASADQDDFFIPSVQQDSNAREHIQIALGDYCPGIQQCIFMPLRDYFHDRHTAVIFGWTRGFNRVYAGSTDLPSVASFGTALMTQLRRLETLALTRKQSDFLGSVSHEMRSPLHGILACIEHLRTTDCSAQQLDLLESAAACGLQLNNNIDNILQISQIGVSSPTTRTSKQSLLRSDADMTSQSHGAQRHPSTNTLLHHITSLVDETMRLHECITMPLQIVDHDMNLVPTRMAHTLVTLDAPLEADISIVYCPALDAIVKNLCQNCLKFAREGSCVRISVQADEENVNILFTDSGRGISQDFLTHGLFKLFSQQDPLDPGLGLGLTLVQRAVRDLGGSIKFDSDESTGSEVQVSLPRCQLDSTRHDSLGQAVSNLDPWNLKLDASDLADVQLFTPAQWRDQSDPRNFRSMRAMADSLDHTFRTWLGIRCKCWDAEGEKPKILLILDTDLQHAREALGGDFPVTWKIIIYPESTFQPQPSEQGVFVGVTGSLNPFKLRAALLKCHELQSARNHEAQQPCIKTDYAPSFDTTPSVQHVAIANTSSLNKSPTIHVTIKEIEAPLQVLRLNSESDDVEVKREPRFLLVDDNAINLKVIGMFAKKCSEEPFTLAAGGQEAIDAFKTTQNGADDKASAPRFDIILLDLSMPEVSGFEAASTIRSIEKAAGDRSRTYIAALTGLVSEKDRNAAFAAGVDEYVTKPASIQDLRGVVSNWRKTIPPA